MRYNITIIPKHGFLAFLSALWTIPAAESGLPSTDIQILRSTSSECVVSYSPEAQKYSRMVKGLAYETYEIEQACADGEPGDPMIPCRILSFGIPWEGDSQLFTLQSEYTEESLPRLLPVPRVERVDGFPVEIFEQGPVYKSDAFFPASPVVSEEPSVMGDRRILRVRIYPVQYHPETHTVRLYTRIVIRVAFPSSPAVIPPFRDRQDGFYRKALVNDETAHNWRLPRKRPPLARALSQKKYKIPVSQEGLYQITGQFLKSKGIDIAGISVSTLKIYNNGGQELPRSILASVPDSIENPVLAYGMEDGRFDDADYLIFYARGVTGWSYSTAQARFNHYVHPYTDKNIYWLVFNDGVQGKRIQTLSAPSGNVTRSLSTFKDHLFLEEDKTNPLNAGIYWFGDYFDNAKPAETYALTLLNPVSGDTMLFRMQMAGGTSGTHRFQILFNEQTIKTFNVFGNIISTQEAEYKGSVLSGGNTLGFQYTGSSVASKAYLNWFEIQYSRQLQAYEGRLPFFSPEEEGLYEYRLSGFSGEPLVWKVTELSGICRMALSQSGSQWVFTDSVAGSPDCYFASLSGSAFTPVSIEEDTDPTLKNPLLQADMILITPESLEDQAMRFRTHRETRDSLSILVVRTEDVYDDFSGGLPDPAAIRNFVRYAYENWSSPPSFLLLFGDGHYDYRNLLKTGAPNLIFPFEESGFSETGSRATDDWYTYVSGNDTRMDLAVGRVPVQNEAEAGVWIDKLIQYESSSALGDWRSLITLVGDDEKAQHGDEDEVTHTRAAEFIAENRIPPLYNLKKIYLSEYPEVITAEGRRKPQARDDLIEQINLGTVFVDFVGHGNEEVWTHEYIFLRDRDMPALNNTGKLPIFYAATCAFALYDSPKEQSFSEELLNTEGKGAIAVIAASRFCSASPNEALNKAFIKHLFSESGGLSIGEALRLAKFEVASTSNNEMYHVLGDPSMRPGIPRYQAELNRLDPDTLKALAVTTADGEILKDGTLWAGFSGTVTLKCYDAERKVEYKTRYGTPLNYQLPGNTLFRGQATASSGRFEISFIVPKDISYGENSARISVYFSDELNDGAGYKDRIGIRGSKDLVDMEGPEILFYFDGQENFISGDMVSGNPDLIAEISDDTGVNITGEIGHKIMLTIDETVKEDITGYFQYKEGSYSGGTLRFPLPNLLPGTHELSLKAWDNANNSSTETVICVIVPRDNLRIENVLNYPNPFSGPTQFTFQMNQDAAVEIRIFTVSGRLIRRLDGLGEAGLNIIPWDGRDEMGDYPANGVYLYKVTGNARVDGKEVKNEVIGRLLIMR